MKVQALDQFLKCSQCRTPQILKELHRLMNFTSGEVIFYCRNCRKKMGLLAFGKWNLLNREFYNRPPGAAPSARMAGEGRNQGRNRGRGRDRNRNRRRSR